MVINLMVQRNKKNTQKEQIQAYVSRLFKQLFQVSHDRKKKGLTFYWILVASLNLIHKRQVINT